MSTTYITEQHAAGSTRDEIIIGLVTGHGMTLNAATKAYAEVAKAEGWTASIVSHKAEALEFIASEIEDVTVDEMRRLRPMIEAEFGVAESTATDYLKAYCEEQGEAYPVLNPREAIFAWFKAQDGIADKAEFMAYATEELGRSQSNANEYWKGYELHLHLIGQ